MKEGVIVGLSQGKALESSGLLYFYVYGFPLCGVHSNQPHTQDVAGSATFVKVGRDFGGESKPRVEGERVSGIQ